VGVSRKLYRGFSGGIPPLATRILTSPGLLHWWDPKRTDLITTGTGVSQILCSVTGDALSQAVGTKQPPRNAVGSCPSGYPSFSWTAASNQELTGAPTNGLAAANAAVITVYSLLRVQTRATAWCIGSSTAVELIRALSSSATATWGQAYKAPNNAIANPGTGITINDDVWWMVGRNTVNLTDTQYKGSAYASAAPAAAPTMDTLVWGSRYDNGLYTNYIDQESYGLLVYDGTQNDAYVQSLFEELMGV
jgi:hypothetical protein